MKTVFTLATFLLLSFFANAQVQFAGAHETGTYAVNSNGKFGQLHTYANTVQTFQGPLRLMEGTDGKLYFVEDSKKISSVNNDGTAHAVLTAVSSTITSGLSQGPGGKIYFVTADGKAYSFHPAGSVLTYLADVPECHKLFVDADNWMYGVSKNITPNIIYRIKTDGTDYTVLRTLNGSADGIPGQGVALCNTPGGRLFGAMPGGGANGTGTIFSMQKDGTDFRVHYTFSNTANGTDPVSGAIAYQNGKLFVVTRLGGANGSGTIATTDDNGNNYTKIYDFGDISKPDIGKFPSAGLTPGNNGKLYGSTMNEAGKIYSISEDGLTVSVIHDPNPATLYFNYGFIHEPILLSNNNTLVFWGTGNGANGRGYLYKTDTDGQNGQPVYNFGYDPNGSRPEAGLVKDAASVLYGTTSAGGNDGGGIIFKHNADGTGYTVLHHFTGTQARNPSGKLLLASDGKLYGVCKYGGNPANLFKGGAIYRINTDGTGFQVIKQFNGAASDHKPVGALVEGAGGDLFGITQSSDFLPDNPVIYKINKDGTGYSILKTFNGSAEGKAPNDGLLLFGGYLYGTCINGGVNNAGTIFRIQTSGTGFQVLKQLTYANNEGALPLSGLMAASNNRVYGINSFGGSNGTGTLYSMLPDGSNFIIHRQFDFSTEGQIVFGKLVQATDGRLYCTTINGGANGYGTLFRMNMDGTGFGVIRNFTAAQSFPFAELVQIPFLTTLPVQLTGFIAQKQNSQILLSWRTELETNSKHFIIERSRNAIVFSAIATVAAKGNRAAPENYTAYDLHPFKGKNYYRIKSVDNDGSYTYSSTKLVDFRESGAYIALYPNPVKEQVTIENNLEGNSTSIIITDLSGRIVLQKFVATDSYIQLDTRSLAAGTYIVSVASGVHSFTQKIVKQ